jgi:hypothetical protein
LKGEEKKSVRKIEWNKDAKEAFIRAKATIAQIT